MSAQLQTDTILHNYIDNRNHYLYHFRPLRMKPLPRLCHVYRLTSGDQPHRQENSESTADRAAGRQRV